MAKHTVLVYGTLRPGGPTFTIKGKMFSLGGFPGVSLDGDDDIVVERLEVDDELLKRLDYLEGYHEEAPEQSMYQRVKINDDWIYVYNWGVHDDRHIPGGDWLKHRGESRGSNSAYFNTGQFAAQGEKEAA